MQTTEQLQEGDLELLRHASEGYRKLKAEGMKSGVPDLFLPVARQGFYGLFVELKHGSNQPSETQIAWQDRLAAEGYLALTCWGSDDAIAHISEYLGL